jgi:hypothetical protein
MSTRFAETFPLRHILNHTPSELGGRAVEFDSKRDDERVRYIAGPRNQTSSAQRTWAYPATIRICDPPERIRASSVCLAEQSHQRLPSGYNLSNVHYERPYPVVFGPARGMMPAGLGKSDVYGT